MALGLFSASCTDAAPVGRAEEDAGSQGDAGADAAATFDDARAPVYATCDKMDVLFVIDNSTSMEQEQENLSANFQRFVDSLRNFRDRQVDLHIGVTTTAFPSAPWLTSVPGTAGALLKTETMEVPWLSGDDPDLDAQFAALATVGTSGAWDEQPLKALRASLVEPATSGINLGFLRPDALLAFVIVTDEDDLSTQGDGGLTPATPIPVGNFIETLDTLKGDRGFWTGAVIAGGTAPSCSSSFGDALFASRLLAFSEQAGPSVVFSSICEGDLGVALDASLETFSQVCDVLIF